MNLGPFFSVMTFVSVCLITRLSLAAPVHPPVDQPEAPTENSQSESPTPSTPTSSSDLETLDISVPKEKKTNVVGTQKKDIFYHYQGSVSPRMGFGTKPKTTNPIPLIYLLGLNVMLDSSTHKHVELGADLISDSTGMLHAAMKWIFTPNSSFRPFFKAGPSVALKPNEQLGTFLKFENYQARIGGGFEDLLVQPMSVRVECELGFGTQGGEFTLAIGYSWGW